jgi:hypothetical protein
MVNCLKISTKLTINKYTGFREFMKSGLGGNPRIFSSSNVHEYRYWNPVWSDRIQAHRKPIIRLRIGAQDSMISAISFLCMGIALIAHNEEHDSSK